MIVRPAEPADAGAIALVHTRSWQAAYRGLLSQDYLDAIDVARREAGWRRTIERADARTSVLVAQPHGDGTAVEGFVALGPSRDDDADERVGEVTSIYVSPEQWGRGVGRALIEAAWARLVALDFGCATLWVLDGNRRAVRFYEATGWSLDGTVRHEDFDGVAVTELRMTRDLRCECELSAARRRPRR